MPAPQNLTGVQYGKSGISPPNEILQVAVVTSDFPGSFTMVSRPAKGPALTFNWMVWQHYNHTDQS